MCGIAGKIYFNRSLISLQDIKQMTNAVAHRGPDDEGVYISPDKKAGLGHQRLSIIDLSPAGHQPMNYLSRYWIVYNGEIYNFQEKKDALTKEGYTFKSKTDTEVILALYDKYKEKCLEHLRGAFAFAIYDEKDRVLFCARDRIGKKPLKYYIDKDKFIFASELKAILTNPDVKKEPDFQAIYHYLSFQYVPAPLTGFKNIQKLPPAHYLVCQNGKVKIKKYWSLDFSKKDNLSEEEWTQRIMEKLKECVKIRMISDVPLGALLSGGIDSSTVVGLMSQLSKQPVKTFSIGFKDNKFNELPYAKMIAQKFQTDHTEFIVEPQAIEILPKLVHLYEEPFADSSALPTYYVSKLAKKHVTVALNGDGGDENFAGYPLYNAWLFANKIPYFIRKTAGSFAFLGKVVSDPTLRYRFYIFLNALSGKNHEMYFDFFSSAYFTEKTKHNLFTKEFKKTELVSSYKKAKEYFEQELGLLDQALSFGIKTYLPEDLLVKVDIASMGNALEGRSPLLDHEFLELTAKIPSSLKIKNNQNKYIYKKALKGFLPGEILSKKKQGFMIPLDKWMREDLNKFAKEIILSDKAIKRNIFQKEEIEKLFKEHEAKKFNHGSRIWALLWLELWFQTFFD